MHTHMHVEKETRVPCFGGNLALPGSVGTLALATEETCRLQMEEAVGTAGQAAEKPRESASLDSLPVRRKEGCCSEIAEVEIAEAMVFPSASESARLESQPRTVLPGTGVDDLDEDERNYRAEHEGPVMDVDPEAAAKRRAAKRQQAHALALACITDVPEDLAEAEEDDPEEAIGWNEAGQPVPLEPFNLLRERDEGYFDDNMNYVEYRLHDMTDAWLEGLDQTIKLDEPSVAGKQKKRRVSSSKPAAQEPVLLDDEEQAVYKQRIASVLQPGETVLQALRRLANMSSGQQQQGKPWRREGQGKESHPRGKRDKPGRAVEQDLAQGEGHESDGDEGEGNVFTRLQQGKSGMRQRLKRVLRQQQQQQPHAVSGTADAPEVLDSPVAPAIVPAAPPTSTPAGSTAQALGGGIAPAESGACATSGISNTADEDAMPPGPGPVPGRPAVTPPDPSNSGSRPRPADAPSTTWLGPSRRVPLENSIEFDKLTSYADILLGQCDFDIYNKTREQLLKEVARGAGSTAAGPTTSEQQNTAPGLPSAPAGTATSPGADDDGQDMFAEDFDVRSCEAAPTLSPQEPSSNPHHSPTAGHQPQPEELTRDAWHPEPSQPDTRHEELQAHGRLSTSYRDDQTQVVDHVHGPDVPQLADTARVPSEATEEGCMQGFVLDPDSGLQYNSLIGYYFDPKRMVWRDAWTGLQYGMDEKGQYVSLPQDDPGCAVQRHAQGT